MADVIVTIRLPSALVSELKNAAKNDHYVDVSELIRSVLRRKFVDYEEFQNKTKRLKTE